MLCVGIICCVVIFRKRILLILCEGICLCIRIDLLAIRIAVGLILGLSSLRKLLLVHFTILSASHPYRRRMQYHTFSCCSGYKAKKTVHDRRATDFLYKININSQILQQKDNLLFFLRMKMRIPRYS